MERRDFPANWRANDFDPNDHLVDLKGRSYLNVQARTQWFIRDQRALIVAGLATMPYVIRTEIVEHNPERAYAHFLTYVRDVLGNEATMYGSETGKDFVDYAEKASTKSLGRALAVLGYGIAAAQEMDEGERVVDTPQERRQQRPAPAQPPRTDSRAVPAQPPAPQSQQRDGIALDNGVAATKEDIAALRQAVIAAQLDGAAFVVKVPELCDGRVLDRLTKGDVRDLRRRIADHPEQFTKKAAKTPA